jgi:putative ABC transport system permease protein
MPLALAVASLRRHLARTLLATLGIAVSAAMLLDMVMLASGMRESFRRLLDSGGFEIRVTPKGTVPFDTDATIDDADEVARRIAALPGVEIVAPVLGASLHVPTARGDSSGTRRSIASFALGVVPRAQGDYTLVEGSDATAEDALVANDAFLGATGWRLGDTVDAAVGYDPQLRTYDGSRRLRIVGRARFRYLGAEQRAVALPLATLQGMLGESGRDRVSLFMTKLVPGADAERVGAAIDRAVPRVNALSTTDAVRLAEQRLSYFRQLAFILGAVSLVVGFLLAATLMTVSVNERVGEIAVLRAIGISRLHIVQQIALEALAISAIGAIAGLGLGLVTARYLGSILHQFPGLPEAIDFFLFQPSAAWRALGLLALSGVAAGIYPSWRAGSLPIATTLRREAVG